MSSTGDADLYVRKLSRPSTYRYDCRPWKDGSLESCSLSGADVYDVSVFGYKSSNTYNLSITYTP